MIETMKLNRKQIAMHVAAAFGVDFELMISKDRTKPVCHARFAAMVAIKELTPSVTDSDIGRTLGDRHPTTVVYGLSCGYELMATSKPFAHRVGNALSRSRGEGLQGQTQADGGDTPYLTKLPPAVKYRPSVAVTSETDMMTHDPAWYRTNQKRFYAAMVDAHPEMLGVRA